MKGTIIMGKEKGLQAFSRIKKEESTGFEPEIIKNAFTLEKLSTINSLMIMYQNTTDKTIAGYKQWKKLGRQVKKGEEALWIWYPKATNKENKEDNKTEDFETKFYMGAVFGYNQTEKFDTTC
jgi:antirestriction protein ArdC